MAGKEQLHRLVERLAETEVHAAQRFLEYLCDVSQDPVLQALRDAPDDDEPLSPEEAAESDAAWKAYLEGKDRSEPLEIENVRRELP